MFVIAHQSIPRGNKPNSRAIKQYIVTIVTLYTRVCVCAYVCAYVPHTSSWTSTKDMSLIVLNRSIRARM